MDIGGGFYQGATVKSALTTGVQVAIVHQNHSVAVALRQANPFSLLVLRPDDGNDAVQYDVTKAPESEADRFAALIAARLGEVPRATYSAVTGPNENWPAPGDTTALQWRAKFEARLCEYVQVDMRLPYAALSCPVGNLERTEIALFEEVFERAVMINYHGYLPPHATTLAGGVGPFYLWRPTDIWLPECRRLGLRMPSIFLGEVGTYFPWQMEYVSVDAYSRLCIDIALHFGERCRSEGIPFAGACGFGFGTVGAFQSWRQDGTEAIYAAATAAEVPPEEEPVTGEEFDRWAADVWKRAGVPYVPNNGIPKYWRASAKAGHYLGKPEGPEHQTENGVYLLQEFSSTILHCKVGEWIVSEGLPPFA